jgi:fructose-1,6-bisphosphatase
MSVNTSKRNASLKQLYEKRHENMDLWRVLNRVAWLKTGSEKSFTELMDILIMMDDIRHHGTEIVIHDPIEGVQTFDMQFLAGSRGGSYRSEEPSGIIVTSETQDRQGQSMLNDVPLISKPSTQTTTTVSSTIASRALQRPPHQSIRLISQQSSNGANFSSQNEIITAGQSRTASVDRFQQESRRNSVAESIAESDSGETTKEITASSH